MTLGEYISKYRTEHDLSYEAFGKQVGISKQYVSILEKGVNNEGKPVSPTVTTYAKIARGTGVSETALLAMLDDTVKVNPATKISPLEQKYAALDKHGKKVVDFVLDAEYQRCTKKELVDVPKTRVVPLFRAAAGPGEQVDGTPFEEYEVLSPVPGEFAVKISGDSMEPELHDGEVVMCMKRAPQPGEIGVIMVNGFLLVKQVQADNNGIYLRSLNRDRANLDVDLPYESNDTITSYGTVIHKKLPFVK